MLYICISKNVDKTLSEDILFNNYDFLYNFKSYLVSITIIPQIQIQLLQI